MAMENGVYGALGGHAYIAGQAAHQQFTDLPCTPMRLLAFDGDDARLELGRQLIGQSHRPARAIAESLKAVLLIAVEDFVAGFGRPLPRPVD
jgi:hypothetical protein